MDGPPLDLIPNRVWELQHRLSLAEARIEGLQNTDGQHREEMAELRREQAAMRSEMAQGFKDLTSTVNRFHGEMRQNLLELRNLPPLTPPVQPQAATPIPMRWLIIGALGLGALFVGAGIMIGEHMSPATLADRAATALGQ